MFKEYKGYHINEDGVVLGISGKVIKGTKNSKGYYQTTGKNKKKYLIHRLIAECWIDCPGDSKLYHVNHIDGDKSNNCITNLEWLVPKDHCNVDNKRRLSKNKYTTNIDTIIEHIYSINYII